METMNIESCLSLEQVRSNIDRIDEELISLIAQRSRYVDQAAHFKTNVSDVVSVNRVQQVIDKVRLASEQEGLNPSITEKIFRTMINAFTEAELAERYANYEQIKQSYY